MKRIFIALVFTLLCACLARASATGDCPTSGPAFTIEGFGASVTGGCKGGQSIISVTNVNDSGAGSLRDCVENHTGPRLCKFTVSGTIALASNIGVLGDASNTHGDLTIDGQDAPNGGIAIKNLGSGGTSTFSVTATNVIIRYIRIRQGPPRNGQGAFQVVCDGGFCGQSVVLDHVSVSWGTDGNADFSTGAHDGTYQYCIFSEMSASGNILKRYQNATNLTIHHCLFANATSDRSCGQYTGDLDCVNNVFYNNFSNSGAGNGGVEGMTGVSGDGPVEESTDTSAVRVNYVKNTWKAGTNGGSLNTRPIYAHNYADTPAGSGIWTDSNDTVPSFSGLINQAGPSGNFPLAGSRWGFPAVTTTTAASAFTAVLAGAGATLPCRDSVDTRVVAYVTNGTGSQVTSAADDPAGSFGGWPDLTQPCAGQQVRRNTSMSNVVVFCLAFALVGASIFLSINRALRSRELVAIYLPRKTTQLPPARSAIDMRFWSGQKRRTKNQ